MVEVFVALEAPTLDRLPRANGRAPSRAIPPPPTTATSVPPTVRPAIGPPVVRSGPVATPPLRPATPDRTVATSVVGRRTPASGLHRMARYKERWEGAWRHGESRHRRHHTVHTEVLKVEPTWCPRGTLAARLREVAIRVRIGPRRRDVSRIQYIRIDELELLSSVRNCAPRDSQTGDIATRLTSCFRPSSQSV